MLQGHSSSVYCVAFSPDGKYLASGSNDKTVKFWSVESQKEVTTLQGHSSYILSVALSPDGKYLASGSNDKTVKLWSVESKKEVATL
jgi:WD40 repeat protein